MLNNEDIIKKYLAAYERANKTPAPFTITFERSWFILKFSDNVVNQVRKPQLRNMLDRLLERINDQKL